ncbi:MAG: amidase [Firmicutes bacterium]|nr:amidase [Bacillota bacterium]
MTEMSCREMTIEKYHKALLEGTITCKALTQYYLDRIATFDDQIKAVIMINPNALEEAEKMDLLLKEKGLIGPLHGVPVLVKDNFETAGMETTAGSMTLKGFIPEKDAFILDKILKSGGIVVAKANLHEFAIWGETVSSVLGQSYNPYDLTRTPGGSSGGTGAGMAADYALLGLGTDTINSVRSPASANNLVGIRPTLGLLSRSGIVPYSYTQDTAGPLTRTVADAAIALEIMKGYDPEDPITKGQNDYKIDDYTKHLDPNGLSGKRIGILKSLFGAEAWHDSTNRAVNHAIEKMKHAGAEIIYLEDAIDTGHLVKEVSVHLHDFKDHLNQYLQTLPAHMPYRDMQAIYDSGLTHPGVRSNIEEALTLSTSTEAYQKRIASQEDVRNHLDEIFKREGIVAMVYPHQKQLVCKAGSSQLERNGVLSSVTGYPSICVPAGFSEPSEEAPIGVPIGLEILGRPFTEETLIEIAFGYESIEAVRMIPRGF